MRQPSISPRRPLAVRGKRRRCLSALVVALTALPVLAQAELVTAADAAPSATQVFVGAVADARVLEASPTTNYGSLSRLDVDNPGQQSYLRFNVSGVSGAVQRATLRLFVRNGSSNGPSLYRTGAAWTEAAITWNNRPAATSGAIANVGTATAGTWSEYDLTGQVTGNGTHDFVLLPDSTDGVQYDSREGPSAPQLVLEIGDGGSVNAPPVAVDDTVTTLADTAVDINVAANDHDPDGNLAPTSATTSLHRMHHAGQRCPRQQWRRHLPLHTQHQLHRHEQLHLPDLRHPRILRHRHRDHHHHPTRRHADPGVRGCGG